MCDISGGISAYETLNATVYAISVDSPFAQEVWARKEGITVTILSDLNKTVTQAYDRRVPQPCRSRRHRPPALPLSSIRPARSSSAEQTCHPPRTLPNFAAIQASLEKIK